MLQVVGFSCVYDALLEQLVDLRHVISESRHLFEMLALITKLSLVHLTSIFRDGSLVLSQVRLSSKQHYWDVKAFLSLTDLLDPLVELLERTLRVQAVARQDAVGLGRVVLRKLSCCEVACHVCDADEALMFPMLNSTNDPNVFCHCRRIFMVFLSLILLMFHKVRQRRLSH